MVCASAIAVKSTLGGLTSEKCIRFYPGEGVSDNIVYTVNVTDGGCEL